MIFQDMKTVASREGLNSLETVSKFTQLFIYKFIKLY